MIPSSFLLQGINELSGSNSAQTELSGISANGNETEAENSIIPDDSTLMAENRKLRALLQSMQRIQRETYEVATALSIQRAQSGDQ